MTVDTTTEPGGAAVGNGDVEGELVEVAGHLNAQHGRLVRLTERAIATKEWHGAGIVSAAQWLTIQAGLSSARAKQIVTIAERAAEFPHLMAAFEAGELAIDQVYQVAAKAPCWADERVTDFAKVATVNQLRRVIRDEYFDDGEPEPEPATRSDRDRVGFGFDEHGRFDLHANLSADDGLIVDDALNEARDALFRSGNTQVTWVDALVEIAQRSLGGIPTERRERYKTYLHLDIGSGRFDTTSGVVLSDSLRNYLTCDGLVQPVWEIDNTPIGVGRTQRIVPDRTRRVVEHRDQGCRVPGCAGRHVEIHHIIHWSDGGPTETWNLICLCPRHHKLHHRGVVLISGSADAPGGVTFTDADGQPFGRSGAPPPVTGPPPEPAGVYQHPSGGRLDARWVLWSKAAIEHVERIRAHQHLTAEQSPN